MAQTKIEWTATYKDDGTVLPGFSFNPWIGCTRVSEGCTRCYAETLMADRYKKVTWGPQGARVRTSADYWKQPLKWNREAEKAGERRRVFCASLADVFEPKADQYDDMESWRRELFSLIAMTPHLDWLILTKRPELARAMVPVRWLSLGFPFNVWIGTSVENQEYADKRIPELLKIPAAVRFLSCEPLLGPINLTGNDERSVWPWGEARAEGHGIDWVIVGGESGHDARPMHPDWARSIRDQCQAAGVPFLFKQWGEWRYRGRFDAEMRVYQQLWIDHDTLDAWERAGKKAAGRLLDGREWNEFPVTVTADGGKE